ncbi:MAG TPA: hypothetical protein DEG17_27305 [Cyanobacteria bacterium UBA11149]|nr:hypothetical protein [Cyanobacteria bacterium UBA11366]HBK62236.1 hypothetical protein [Cyanobacteria bacterium UBA11166]HBR74322.1 hypothetical protein [Cyanobacteria bacterium UBA11159]HBS68514.1 hypothetical protein [Cyanobacteria bacterium UBA11153]HBW92470.1 hypothetical protein [Cyanobacteria bacterium UBA11149]HCA93180.1 hypothetical protein [Cyanobacteria bacterium UBA9226]
MDSIPKDNGSTPESATRGRGGRGDKGDKGEGEFQLKTYSSVRLGEVQAKFRLSLANAKFGCEVHSSKWQSALKLSSPRTQSDIAPDFRNESLKP